MKKHVLIFGLLILASVGCRHRQGGDNPTTLAESSSEMKQSAVQPNSDAAVCSSSLNEVKTLAGKALSNATKFAAASIEQTGASGGPDDQELWFLLLGSAPEADGSVYSVNPRITVSFRGWPIQGTKYPVSDDCYEPRRSDSPVAVCGPLQVTGGEVVYTKVPDRRGGEVQMEFDFTDALGQGYSGVAQACVNPPLVATLEF